MRSGVAGLCWLVALLLAGGAAACGDGGGGGGGCSGEPADPPEPAGIPTGATGEACEVPAPPATAPEWDAPSEPALRQELLEMRDADTCGACGYQPCWHEYADVVNAALHEGPVELTRGPVGTDIWRAAKRARASIYGW